MLLVDLYPYRYYRLFYVYQISWSQDLSCIDKVYHFTAKEIFKGMVLPEVQHLVVAAPIYRLFNFYNRYLTTYLTRATFLLFLYYNVL